MLQQVPRGTESSERSEVADKAAFKEWAFNCISDKENASSLDLSSSFAWRSSRSAARRALAASSNFDDWWRLSADAAAWSMTAHITESAAGINSQLSAILAIKLTSQRSASGVHVRERKTTRTERLAAR
jgi:hypothetical protein